ncbi:hypothetical protein RINTHH_10590 [Richelia intracellularis HH01]|uniref:Uncharacterized protein n=1 Tax=Richelia intracellularis HH01 TaxID=1165094 RepID=M1WS38_9NOST|nr:hypothetical protein [Richelia intracellularis]CCH67214.1 hypothetical protein RINTHH_10590 [Richelia intracellularis HH01]
MKSQWVHTGGCLLIRYPWEVNILGFLVCLEGVDKVKKYEEITKEKIVDSNLITEILVGRLPNG